MNILIFDDDISTVQMLMSKIDWGRLGIDEIYPAYSINQAKEIFRLKPNIDIMLCDIEAPGGTGIDLLRWARENSLNTENIFLTNHAEFSYAKEAIQLGCVDYIIKLSPLSAIEDAVRKAINKVKLNNMLLQYKFYEEYWAENHSVVTEQFWKELLLRNSAADMSEMESMVMKRKVDVDLNEEYFITLISYTRNQDRDDMLDDFSHLFVVKNFAMQIILDGINSGYIIYIEKGTKKYLSLILGKSIMEEIGTEKFKKNFNDFISFCNSNLGCNVNCYLGGYVRCEKIGLLQKKLEDFDLDNVCSVNKVFDITEHGGSRKKKESAPPETAKWAQMLKEGKNSTLFISVKNYIEEIARTSDIDASFMNAFQKDFLQMVFSVLEQEHIQAHKLFSDEKSNLLFIHAVNSVYDMLKWVDYTLNKTSDCINEARKLETVTDKIKEYIELNFNKDISRNDIANKFFLNPDYLSRIFNKETGLSIPEYQARLRVNKAKELLKMGMSISETAALVGYDNFSYFSTVYKKIEGITPAEFRKKYQQQ